MGGVSVEDLEYILLSRYEIWQGLKDKSVFLTGGTGFFGKWLLESFVYINRKLALNATITVLSRDPETFLKEFPVYSNEPAVNFMKGNILDFSYPDKQYEFIVHAATDADADLNKNNPLLMLDTITKGTRRVLDFARMQPVESFLLTSSGAIYGKQPENITHTSETDSFAVALNDPLSAYAEGKRLSELYCAVYQNQFNIPVKIARCFAFVGPYLPLNKHFAIGNFIYNCIQDEDIVIKGDGSPFRSYLYAADLALWLWIILMNGEVNVPYNVGSGEALCLSEVAHEVAKVNPTIGVKVYKQREEGKPVERYVPNIDFTMRSLGIGSYVNLQEAIRRTIRFYGQN